MTLSSKLKSCLTRYFSPCVEAKDEAKQKLLNPLSSSAPNDEAIQEDFKPHWVIGIDPDLFGALAVLKFDHKGSCSAQVYDTPRLQYLVQKIVRSGYDAKSMVELIRTLGVPSETKAFIAKSIPVLSGANEANVAYNAGQGYGLWTGILLTSQISVTAVHPSTWKKHFRLSIWSLNPGRKLASEMFPSLCSQLARKNDYPRSNALLIAAYGQATSETQYYSFSQV